MNRASTDALDKLYAALDRMSIRPGDVIPQLRIQGKRINALSELSEFEVHKLIRECEALEARQRKAR